MKYLFILIVSIPILLGSGKFQSTSQSTNATITYDVVFRESLAGIYKKWSIDDNSFGFSYEYTDRGRGPKYFEELTLNSKGFIKKQSITGVNYLKDSVNETFESIDTKAYWINPEGKNESDFNGEALYMRYDGSPGAYEVLAKLLLKSIDKKVRLFPKGEVELVDHVYVTIKDSFTAKLLTIKGLDMGPSYLWLDNDNQLIAQISGNLHIVRKDLNSLRLEMKRIQDSVEDDYLFNVARNFTHSLDKVVIKNVNVFTERGTLILNQDVFVESNTIQLIVPTGTKDIAHGVKVMIGTGKTLMPGMFDMHTHNDKFRGAMHIAGGVTSVRDLANNKQLKNLSNQFDDNKIVGPRIVTFCGIIDGSGPYANQRNVVDNLEAGLAEIQEYKDLGYQQIKLYSSIRPEWVEPLTKKAHELGMKVSGHIPAYMTASQAINKGYNEIQHINMVLLNFLSDTIDTRTPLRFTMVAKHSADLDLKSKEYLDFISLLKTKEIRVDPTVSIFENMFTANRGEASATYNKIIDRLPLLNQRTYLIGGLPKLKGQEKRHEDSFNKMLEVVNDLYNKGVQIVPGTDGLPGFLYHRELELYVQAGIPASEVLKLATIKSAEITGVSDLYGSIKVGKQADLILIDGNPLEDISNIRRVEWTMKGGKLFYAKELYASMGVKHFK
ncbi:amidohydrolase family protein [Mariniflexile sp.]|uniref:amidohydrolase family protein n=1 Tax=Mariniflexile sp. TaxID=1979402 RepID=UPI0035633771